MRNIEALNSDVISLKMQYGEAAVQGSYHYTVHCLGPPRYAPPTPKGPSEGPLPPPPGGRRRSGKEDFKEARRDSLLSALGGPGNVCPNGSHSVTFFWCVVPPGAHFYKMQ